MVSPVKASLIGEVIVILGVGKATAQGLALLGEGVRNILQEDEAEA